MTFSFRVYSLAERQVLNCEVPIERIPIISNVDAPNFRGETLLHVTAKSASKDLAGLLMVLASNVSSEDYQQQTPLHLVPCSRCQEIANAVIRHGSDAKARDDSQQTPLHLAALKRHRKVLQVLIQSGNDANAKQRLGWTPLHLAASAGHEEIGEVLVQHGSVINITDDLGYTPLHLAAMIEHLQMVQFIIRRGSDVKARFGEFQLSALHGTLNFGHKQIAELLIHHGSDVNAGNKFRGHQELTEFLLQHLSGGQVIDDHLPNYDINVRNNGRQSPVHLAAENDYKHICDVLTHNGSDVNNKDNFGETPLHLITINRHESVAEILGKQHERLLNTTDLLRQTRYKCDPRDASVVWTGSFLIYLESGRSLEDLLEVVAYINETNFPQTSCKPIPQETQCCLASVNLSIGRGDDVSGPLDHSRKVLIHSGLPLKDDADVFVHFMVPFVLILVALKVAFKVRTSTVCT